MVGVGGGMREARDRVLRAGGAASLATAAVGVGGGMREARDRVCVQEVRLVWLLLRFVTACSGLVCRRGGEETGGRSGIVACGCDVVCEGWAWEARLREELLWSV